MITSSYNNNFNGIKGFTLVELLLTMVVIMTIIFTTVKYYSTVKDKRRTHEVVKQIDAILAGAVTWRLHHSDFSGVSWGTIDRAGNISRSTPFGDLVGVISNATTVTIIFPIKQSICYQLVDKFQNKEGLSTSGSDCDSNPGAFELVATD